MPAKWIFAGLLFLLLGRLSYWSEPYGVSVDESTYMSISEIPLNGGALYKDAVDRKPPLLFATYALVGFIFGPWNIDAIHFVFLAITLLIAFGLRRLAPDKKTGNWVFVGYCLFSSCFPRETISANAEYLMTASLIWAFAILETRCFLSFFLMAISVFFKQYSVLIFIPFLIVRWVQFPKKLKRELPLFAAANLLVISIIFFYFYRNNAMNDFIYYTFLDGINYVSGSRKIENHSTSVLTANMGMFFSWLPLWVGFFYLLWNQRKTLQAKLPLLAATLGALTTIYLSARYYTHYFVPFLAFLSMFGILGFNQIKSSKQRRSLVGLSLFIFIGYAAFNYNREIVSDRWAFTRAKQEKLQTVSNWIKENSEATDRIVVWGMASQIYVMSKRGSGTRFVFADFVSGRQPGLKSEVSIPTPGAQEKFIDDILKNKPALIVDTSSAEINDYQWFPLKNYPEIYKIISENYQLTANDSGFLIWKRISS